MKIVIYGSSILSSYWNGAATYYRGLFPEVAKRGHEIVFCEPLAYERGSHRDVDHVEGVRVLTYEATEDGLARALDEGACADAVVKTSGVGVFDDALLDALFSTRFGAALRIFWDVDAPATLAEMKDDPDHPLRRRLGALDVVFTYGGGDPVVAAYRAFGATSCRPIYNALDPATHHMAAAEARFRADLSLLANRLPDREARIDSFFLQPARRAPHRAFLLGGSGWEPHMLPSNIRAIGHVSTRDHNAFNASALAVLNVARDSMAATGFSPATRVFEAAGAGSCIITDAWPGLELFLTPGEEILAARDGCDVSDLLDGLTPERARQIGDAARRRVLRDHVYEQRAREVDVILRETLARRREEALT